MKKQMITALLLWISGLTFAQDLTLDQCYEKARMNFPVVKQKELLAATRDYSIGNARTGYFPQVSILGQATYQSDVTKIAVELPGFSVKPLAKDQYKIQAEVSQSIYDGGTIKRQQGVYEANSMVEDQRVEAELYKVRERINQLFFGILLIDEQLVQVDLLKKDIQSSQEKVDASIRNGIAFKMNADILQAEQLKADQRRIELVAGRSAYLQMLGLFIGMPLNEGTKLEKPSAIQVNASADIQRPELTMYQYQSQLITAQQMVNNTRLMPRLGLFVQGGYGRPGLNVLKNEFSTYYIGGLRLNWNLSGFYNSKRDKEQLAVNLKGVDIQKELFLFNTNLTLSQQSSDLRKLDDMIKVDRQMIELRTRIKNTAKAQLDNGVATANDYLRELNAEDQARQNLALHELQLLSTQYNLLVTTGSKQ